MNAQSRTNGTVSTIPNAREASATSLLLPLLNSLIIVFYMGTYDLHSRRPLQVATVALVLSSLTVLAYWVSKKAYSHLHNTQIAFLSICVPLLILEVVGWTFPSVLPDRLRNYLAARDITEVRNAMVEQVAVNPFVKFRPNTVIRSQGYRGTPEQFVYSWRTDELGFKNTPGAAKDDSIEIVALGDSFTEGMGVATEDTWPSQLTARGWRTYNLGVQGYAPIQLEGSLREYGMGFAPRYIIIGYFAATYRRERAFFDIQRATQHRQFTGGIQSVLNADVDPRQDIRSQARYVSSALYLLAREVTLQYMAKARLSSGGSGLRQPFKKYGSEIASVDANTDMSAEDLQGSREWQSTLRAFRNIIGLANQFGAEVILLYLPDWAGIYYEAATRRVLPDGYFEEIEAALLDDFTRAEGIGFVNPSDLLRNYVNTLGDDAMPSEYPYLEFDGHMSPRGHALVAEQILAYLKSQ